MGYQTRALPGSGTGMMESGIRNRITEWYLFVEKKKIQILQKFSMFRKEADLAQKMADAAGMLCWENDGMLRYFSQILYS